MTVYAPPGSPDSLVTRQDRYDNFIGGDWVEPKQGRVLREHLAGQRQGLHRDRPRHRRGHRARPRRRPRAPPTWGRTSLGERSLLLNRIADRLEENLEDARGRRDVGQRQAGARDPRRRPAAGHRPLPLLRRASCAPRRASISEIDENTVAYHFHEPLGVVAPDHPVELPDPDGRPGSSPRRWRPATASCSSRPSRRRGRSSRSSSSSATCCPTGVLNVVNGFGVEAGKPLASQQRVAKVAFTGETTTGRLIMQYASENIIPVTLELGGKSPNIFFEDVAAAAGRLLRQGARGLHDVRPQPGRGVHLPVAGAHPALDLRRLHGRRRSRASRRSSRATRSTPTR